MKKIIHVDMDYFFAQVEEVHNPALKDVPVGIGGISSNGRGVLSTSNYIARKYGVRSAMPTALALKKCPHLKLVRPNFKRYKEASLKVFEIFTKYTDKIQKLSLDEAYLDVTECPYYNNDAVQIAKAIKKEIYDQTGLTASAGVSYNKLLAKIGSDLFKPNGLSILRPENIEKNISHFPISKIWGVGKVTQKKMHQIGIHTFGDLQRYEKHELAKLFGDFGVTLFNYCRGIDHREVSGEGIRKSLSTEHTFNQNTDDLEELSIKLEGCFEEMISRLGRYNDRKVKSMVVKIKFEDFNQTTIECPFTNNVLSFSDYKELMLKRLSEYEKIKPIRLLGTGVKFFSPKKNRGQMELEL